MVPLRGNEFDDGVFGLLESGTRLFNHQLVDLCHISGWQVAFFVAAIFSWAGHTGQSCLDIEQRASNIHQQRIARLTLARR